MSDTSTPQRGYEWLRLKLLDGASRLWREPETTRFDWRVGNPVLVNTKAPPSPPMTWAQEYFAESDAAKLGLKASEAVAMMSIRIRAKDHTRRGRVVETWLRCELIRRQIIRLYPTRDGVSHDRYSILIAFLVHSGIAQHRANGTWGYEWTPAYKTMKARADWLLELASRAGELRNPKGAQKYTLLD